MDRVLCRRRGTPSHWLEAMTYLLELDAYERDNLLWLLDVARRLGLDTGDWLGQIRFKLHPEHGTGHPNVVASETDAIVTALRGELNE